MNTVSYLDRLFGNRGYPFAYDLGDNNTLIFQRVWVTLTIGGTNYYLDPAFKVSEPVAGIINLANAMGYSSNALMTAAGGTDTGNYVTNLNEANLRSSVDRLYDQSVELHSEQLSQCQRGANFRRVSHRSLDQQFINPNPVVQPIPFYRGQCP